MTTELAGLIERLRNVCTYELRGTVLQVRIPDALCNEAADMLGRLSSPDHQVTVASLYGYEAGLEEGRRLSPTEATEPLVERETIPTWEERCEIHPDHECIVTERMIKLRMQEEIDDLRAALSSSISNAEAEDSGEVVQADALLAHVENMQAACANYLEPTTYIARHPTDNGIGLCKWNTEFPMPERTHAPEAVASITARRDQAFINDIIYMLDGPEQREAFARHRLAARQSPDSLVEALEPFALISTEGVIASDSAGHVTITTCAEYFHRAAAVLASLSKSPSDGEGV